MKMRMADLGPPFAFYPLLAALLGGPYHVDQPKIQATFTGTHHEPTLEQR